MTNIIEATQRYGSSEVYTKGDFEHAATTVKGMRADVLKRAKQTLSAVKAYEGGKLKAPMTRSGQNAIVVKIGYGDRNEKLFEYVDGKAERRINGDTV
ncbi:MAG: hypothetical protein ACJAVM_002342 [Sulfitobacter sp.]|jgi:hypothetical protein